MNDGLTSTRRHRSPTMSSCCTLRKRSQSECVKPDRMRRHIGRGGYGGMPRLRRSASFTLSGMRHKLCPSSKTIYGREPCTWEDHSMAKRPDSGLTAAREQKAITSQLFEAYLDCPTKCFLRSTGEVVTGNAFAIWNHTRSEAYHLDGCRRLTADQPQEFGSCSSEPGRWKSADWLFARSQCVSATKHGDHRSRGPANPARRD